MLDRSVERPAVPTHSRQGPFSGTVVDVRVVDGMTLVTLAGDLDLASASGLRGDLTGSKAASRPDVAVDLRQVTFMDCSVVGVLVAAYKRVRAAGGCLRLVGDDRGPLRLIRLCKLDRVLCVHDSLEVATATVCHRHRVSARYSAPDLLRAG
jgi:anti-sigma B factor antagonist